MSEARSALARDWQSAGLRAGDTVLVHSSVSRTLRRIASMGERPDPSIIVQSLLDAVGDSGTVVFPLFNFEFTQGVPFDIRESKSAMGAITESARVWPGAVRTGHPIYSFAAIGNNSSLFSGVENFSGYGSDSPFAILHELKAKIAVIDLPDQNSMTFYHYVEESKSVPYRYHKKFTGKYIDKEGVSSEKTFGLFVRDIERGVRTAVDPMGEILWEKGLYSGLRPKEGHGMRVIRCDAMYDEVSDIIDQGRAEGVLFEIQH
ncbi:AAC(3) family N-acetyltransferase [Pseudomonas aeruginosa]|uniref:AAC(3) family N-acetyltransferase n=1 Tax=Pseudomonas aeruginosa TaxID=287 RepID=UPI0009A935B9|nr:AAC(3) family N-acetyltransferase [Pseudomonas aeruginosa]EMD8985944.1 AAC(3) family N-acetyltransferase [Pseudomonas aeruginosa]MBH8938823.1 AAC(3) family N-acetyltransferase [Pseudomonas aeruginosa]PBM08870.1 hypothetical protein B8B88_25275 [Pseudomonas aeruginosa]PBM09621.1 hypothetical protein B8B58_16920 [Pseudomonas aeruginosa]PBM36066.1 hypothetical protein B8A59_27085 [Pseudomonas aeruginosa]